jgi:hypothetical protein
MVRPAMQFSKKLAPLLRLIFNIEPFKSRVAMLNGEGSAIDKRPCGCVLWAYHDTNKKEWLFLWDYSNCKEKKNVPGHFVSQK